MFSVFLCHQIPSALCQLPLFQDFTEKKTVFINQISATAASQKETGFSSFCHKFQSAWDPDILSVMSLSSVLSPEEQINDFIIRKWTSLWWNEIMSTWVFPAELMTSICPAHLPSSLPRLLYWTRTKWKSCIIFLAGAGQWNVPFIRLESCFLFLTLFTDSKSFFFLLPFIWFDLYCCMKCVFV